MVHALQSLTTIGLIPLRDYAAILGLATGFVAVWFGVVARR
ncbi:MAG: hypothetical protein OWQ57_08480 [Sulfobacillus sp.]|nr:hypothetical protein [Sulfobacillus sp.]